jgi:hypothetical protein
MRKLSSALEKAPTVGMAVRPEFKGKKLQPKDRNAAEKIRHITIQKRCYAFARGIMRM